MPSRRNVRSSARVLGQLIFLAVFAVAALSQPALADYAGKSLLMWSSQNIIAPQPEFDTIGLSFSLPFST